MIGLTIAIKQKDNRAAIAALGTQFGFKGFDQIKMKLFLARRFSHDKVS
jgi:hypothetical protein